tara:strand:+ start:3874 stop:4650 length:777 start_codon:yes stop_codon:yes gene_type:complete
MKTIKLQQVEHNIKIGKKCEYIEPNVKEECLLEVDGEIIGFYIPDLNKHDKKLVQLISIANKEFRSKNVPKSAMNRTSGERGKTEKIQQYSTILGSVAPRPHMRRDYPSICATHKVKSAQIFIKAMLGAALQSEKIIKKLTPHIYNKQVELFKDVNKKWRFGNLFTSSISNYNISAPFHRDTGNIEGAVNVIITKRHNSKGGSLNVPDYNATFEQADNSMLVYPAWKNIHGVTPIKPMQENGYRNSLIFYPLKAFKGI